MCISNAQAFRFVIWLKRIYQKYSLGHVALILSYVSFIIISATLFFLIESFNSNSFRSRWQQRLAVDRNSFVVKDLLPEIFNNSKLLLYIHDQKSQYLTAIMNERLETYENQLKLRPPMPSLPCTFVNSLLFVFSTITTIGYGYIYPVTQSGRILSIIISLIGIPFTIIVVKDLAYLIAKLMNYPCDLLAMLWMAFRYCTLRPLDETELERKLYGTEHTERKDYRLDNTDRLLAIPVTVAVLAVIGWTSLGCLIVHFYMPSIDVSIAFYFIFNSLATIGVGDIEPGKHPLILMLLFVYLLIGLSIVSLFINLLHTKFSQAYWLPGRMYIPLRQHANGMGRTLASFDSFDEINLNDCPLNHYTTLGVIQADDKCPLLGITSKQFAIIDADTQTEEKRIDKRLNSLPSPSPVRLPIPHTSHEDVNALIIETYSSRPARLITSTSCKK